MMTLKFEGLDVLKIEGFALWEHDNVFFFFNLIIFLFHFFFGFLILDLWITGKPDEGECAVEQYCEEAE